MYKQKYHKYKNKYIKLLSSINNINSGDEDNQKGGGFNDPDKIYYDDWEIDAHPEDELPEDELFDEKDDEIINKIFQPFKGKLEGYDVEGVSEELTEFLDQIHVDVGILGKARGRIYSPDEFSDNEYIGLDKKPTKSKILEINNVDSFDNFTERYGFVHNDVLYISWDKVAKNYKGFYLSASALGPRIDDIPYKGKTYPNWVDSDFAFMDNVVLFDKVRELINYIEIKEPFKAKLVDPYSIPEDEFIRIVDPVDNNKILFIDDVKSFDKFTNRYGILRKKKDNKTFISINWHNVNKNYDGFYIDVDNDFLTDRDEMAFFNGNKHESWVNRGGIKAGTVYMFD